jgi:hypothetical protein
MAESFVDSFKTELIADRVWRSRTQLELAVVEYVALGSTTTACTNPWAMSLLRSSSPYTLPRGSNGAINSKRGNHQSRSP